MPSHADCLLQCGAQGLLQITAFVAYLTELPLLAPVCCTYQIVVEGFGFVRAVIDFFGDDAYPLVTQLAWGSSHHLVIDWYLKSVGILPAKFDVPIPEIISGNLAGCAIHYGVSPKVASDREKIRALYIER